MKVKCISNLIGLLFIIAIVIAATVFTSWVVFGLVNMFGPSATLTITGGTAFIDPSDSMVVYGEALVTVSGKGITVSGITVEYMGKVYSATCFTCDTMITSSYPNSGNDIIYIRFFFRSSTSPRVGDAIKVTIAYGVSGETRYTSGYITINE